MYSFEGNYRTKRSQVFDRTEKVTANTIVQKTREERRRRELFRRQHEAAVKLQAFCRGIICRCILGRAFNAELRELSGALLSHSERNEPTAEYNGQLLRILRLLNWCCRRKTDKERLLSVCRLLLSRPGCQAIKSWIPQGLSDELRTLSRMLRIVLRPPQTRAFLELILAPVKWASCCSTSNTQTSLENILVLALNDILVSDGSDYVVSERVVREIGTRLFDSRLSMLALVHTCLSCASDTATPRLIPSINLLYLLITVVLPRLLRGNGSLTSPVLADTSEEMDVDKLDDSEAERPPPMMPSSPTMVHLAYSESAMTGQDSAEAVRCIAWLLMHTLTMPGLPCPRPLKAPAPLIVRSTEDGEQSDSEEDEDGDSSAPVSEQTVPGVQALAMRSRESEGPRSSVFGVNENTAAYIPTWFGPGPRRLHGHSGVRICPLQIEQFCVDNRQITVSLSNRYIQVQSLNCPSFLDKCSSLILNEVIHLGTPVSLGLAKIPENVPRPGGDGEHSRHHVSSDCRLTCDLVNT
ncbi:hypothetical protein FGIG_08729 [Fasciola gigantica]|uniref:Uncharacterized protein n=1 Tax=Fasciola gigantica TaxID=46835 RepID=A0A504YP09_FASGI|nr:hypothetical protein FGIG_08729 [Fasciola gigantica]